MIFVDSGAWFASVVEDDKDHDRAAYWMASNQEPLLTSNYVVDETLTLLRSRRQPGAARRLGRGFFRGRVAQVHFLTPEEVFAAWETFERFADKEWSFTDCTSKVLMERLGIRRAFAFDRHFEQFGTVEVVPADVTRGRRHPPGARFDSPRPRSDRRAPMPDAVPPAPLVLGPGVTLGGGGPLAFILGPCVIEGEAFLRRHARAIAAMGIPFVFKASYDKANRTSAAGFRGGLGAREGCELLVAVGREIGAPVTTDVHSPAEAEIAAAAGVDVLQIPAFLCRQTDLVQTAAATGKIVNVKKGQFLAPWDMAPIAGKLRAANGGSENFFFTERGTTFGYNNLVADMRSLPLMRADGFRTVFDATHSVQRPGGGGGHTTGDGALAPALARAAVAAGCDGLFLETHEDPANAASDGPNQIPLRHLPALLRTLQRIHEAVRAQA